MNRAMSFYSYVFNCDFSKDTIHGCEMAFFPFSEGEVGITGALAKGGSELFPKTEVPNLGFSAEFKDSEGNRIALF